MSENDLINERYQKITNILSGVYVLLCGLFLLLCGTGVIALPIRKIVIPAILIAIGLALITSAIITRNSVSLWLCFAFLIPALIEILSGFADFSHRHSYPLYIAIPAIASFFTMLLTRQYKYHLSFILFFGALALIFMLESLGVGWSIVAPLLVLFIGAIILIAALRSKKENTNEI